MVALNYKPRNGLPHRQQPSLEALMEMVKEPVVLKPELVRVKAPCADPKLWCYLGLEEAGLFDLGGMIVAGFREKYAELPFIDGYLSGVSQGAGHMCMFVGDKQFDAIIGGISYSFQDPLRLWVPSLAPQEVYPVLGMRIGDQLFKMNDPKLHFSASIAS